MSKRIPRRQFLKSAPAAGALAYAAAKQGAPLLDAASRPTATPAPAVPDGRPPVRLKRYDEVTLTDDFWRPKVTANAEVTIPFEVKKRETAGTPLDGGVLEGAIFSLHTHPDPWLQERVGARVRQIAAEPARESNQEFEISATYRRVTGNRDMLDRAIRCADLLYDDFKGHDPPFHGGERDSWNCTALYKATHDPKHLWLATHYLDIRGRQDSVNRSRHNQSYEPVTEQSEAVGHAVNCATLMVSLVEAGVLTGRQDYFDAGHRMWLDAVSRKMYVTGGIGSTGNEGFGEPYSLPNLTAYCESCAVLMFITLNHKLFLATGDGRYIDVMERSMYNNAVDGVGADGHHYFYVNRLASAGDGRDVRWEHASLECCPPNLVRFRSRMPKYIYAQGSDDAVYVNLYVSSRATFKVHGEDLALAVESEMPWGGKSTIRVSASRGAQGAIKLRIPGWTRNRPAPGDLYTYAEANNERATVSLNGRSVDATRDEMGYVTLDRTWKDGDVIEVVFPMLVRRVLADPRVRADRGRMAIERGPIVFCCEWPEAENGKVLDLLFDDTQEMTAHFEPSLFGGAVVVDAVARPITDPSAPFRPVRLIPYHLWANRGPGEMAVWLSRAEYALGDTGPAGGLIFYENPNWAADGWRYLEAAPYDQSAGAKWGCFRHRIEGAWGTAVGAGKQNTLDMLAGCAQLESAAYLAANFVLTGVKGWFLPSRDELALMYRNLRARGLGDFRDGGQPDNFEYWTSTQGSTDMAAHIDFADSGRQHIDDKDYPRRVRAIRAI